MAHHNEKVLVDDVEIILGQILSRYLKADVVAGTMTIPMDDKEELKEQKDVEEDKQ